MSRGKQWLNVDHYMNYQKPNTDRSTWTKSNHWAFGSESFDGVSWPKTEFDETKCKSCGGKGRVWESKGGTNKKRNIKCPEDCEYAFDF